MCAYVERFKKWAWGRGDSWRKGGKKSGLPLHSHFFLSPSRLIRLGNAFKPPKGINPLPPLKAKGSPSRTIGGGEEEEGARGNCIWAWGAPWESICVFKPFEGRGRGDINFSFHISFLFPSLYLPIRSTIHLAAMYACFPDKLIAPK